MQYPFAVGLRVVVDCDGYDGPNGSSRLLNAVAIKLFKLINQRKEVNTWSSTVGVGGTGRDRKYGVAM
jgi:hypothetical protein